LRNSTHFRSEDAFIRLASIGLVALATTGVACSIGAPEQAHCDDGNPQPSIRVAQGSNTSTANVAVGELITKSELVRRYDLRPNKALASRDIIATGSYGHVIRARQNGSGDMVAIKVCTYMNKYWR
jgi:hypothetical protein